MNFVNKLYTWYGKRTVLSVGAVAAVLLVIGLGSVFSTDTTDGEPEAVPATEVTVSSVRSMISGNSFSAVGTVEAVSEANLLTEAGGRVTSVPAKIGDTVRAGAVLATLESGSESAALLQAQGSYEAALAGAQQSDSGERDAETNLTSAQDAALTTLESSFNTVSTVLVQSIDQFFSAPQSMLPGVRVSGNASFLNSERIAYQTLIPTWQQSTDSANAGNITAKLREAETNVQRTILFLNEFITITSTANGSEELFGTPLTTYSPALIAERNRLNTTLASLQSAAANIESAEEAVVRANLGGTSGNVSIANAQVKIALGSLRAAQANYEKTIVRSPISGVINALYLKSGEYVSPSQPAAIVANNDGLQIRTAVSLEDSERLAIGDIVTVDATATGTITAIAGAIDPTTGKVALTISINEKGSLQNGSTVSISFATETKEGVSDIVIPLSSVKMTGSGPVVFTVADDTKVLVAQPVVLGAISGENVIVTEGVTLDSAIVADARGLKEGQEVSVVTK